jgi:fructokinase
MVTLRVVAVGELLWDLLPEGKQLGGAPGNVAHHARELGAEAALVTRVGKDPLGAAAQSNRVVLCQVDEQRPTGTASVSLGSDGQPCFCLAADVAWDHIAFDDAVRRLADTADALCFGTLAQRSPVSRATLQAMLEAAPATTLRVLDLNLRDPYWSREIVDASLEAATVLKVSDSELDRLEPQGGVRDRMARLASRFELDLVALTRGANGSLLYRHGEWVEHPGVPVSVRDAIGAGDAFTATLIVGLLRGAPLDQISDRANRVGAYVCTQPGATPRLPKELLYKD